MVSTGRGTSRAAILAVSGLDGSGKSTVVSRLGELLRASGMRATTWKIGELRSWALLELLSRPGSPYARHVLDGNLNSTALNLDRLTHIVDDLLPRLEHCDVVVIDRFLLDWAAVGRAFGSGPHEIAMLAAIRDVIPAPVSTVLVDVLPEEADRRIRARGQTGEVREGIDYLRRVHRSYREVIPELGTAVRAVDGSASPPQVVSEIFAYLVNDGIIDVPHTGTPLSTRMRLAKIGGPEWPHM